MQNSQPVILELLHRQKLEFEGASKRRKTIAKVLAILAVLFVLLAIFRPNDYQPPVPCNLSERDWSCTGGSEGSGNLSILLIEIFVMPLVAFVMVVGSVAFYVSARLANTRAERINQQLSAEAF